MIRAVAFDFDGIIADTERLHYEAFQRILRPRGMEYTWEVYLSRFVGFDDRDAFRTAFRDAGAEIPDDELRRIIETKAQAFQDVIEEKGVDTYPGVIDLVRSCAEHVPIAICSGALRSDILSILDRLGLSDVFTDIVTAEDVHASKPDPASYRLAAERLAARAGNGIRPAHCLAIEDTPAGIDSAKAAGLSVWGVATSHPRHELTRADRILDSLEGMYWQHIREWKQHA